MNRISMFVLASFLVTGAWAAETPQPKKAAVKKTAAKKAAAPKEEPGKLPKGAQMVSPGVWKWTDPKGVVWVYNETPFGFMKGEQQKEVKAETTPTDWKVVEEGDNIHFERPWPFGGSNKWTKAKNDLNDTERAVWEQHRKTQAAAR